MSIYAGFFKRLFAFIVDLTLVIIVTWLLYLFPFNMLMSKNIDSDYKRNVRNHYNEVTEKYSGTVSYFGSTTTGRYGELKEIYSDGQFTNEEVLNSYRDEASSLETDIKSYLESVKTGLNKAYDEDAGYTDQFYSEVYVLYTYIDKSYTVRVNYDTLSDEEKTVLKDSYAKQLGFLISLLKEYDELNESFDVTDTIAYSTISQKYVTISGASTGDIEASHEENGFTEFSSFIDDFRTYQDNVTSLAALKTVEGTTEIIKITAEVYYNFEYVLETEEFIEELPYYVQVYQHTLYAIIYALSMFTVAFSLYTMVLRGETLGRRIVKIKLTDGHEKEKINPLLCLVHDVLLRFLYILVLGMFSLPLALVAMLGFTIADAVMIRFTKSHKCIRDILSGSRVVESGRY